MVQHEQEKYGWEFLFLGANMDAISAAGRFGIRPDRSVRDTPDRVGTELNFRVVSDTVAQLRRCREIDQNWSEPIAEDYRKSGRDGSTPRSIRHGKRGLLRTPPLFRADYFGQDIGNGRRTVVELLP